MGQLPPPPSEPKSYLAPIAAGVLLAGVGFTAPALSAHAEAEAEAAAAEPEGPALVDAHFESTPEGARITVGEQTCTAPCDLELEAGELEASAALEGFRNASESLTVAEGMEAIRFELEAKPYQLTVRIPDGATLRVGDEEKTGGEMIALGNALDAPLAITVTRRGFLPFETSLAASAFEEADDARTHELEVSLERRAARTRRIAQAAPTGPVPNNPFL
ncbi:MAG: PEGA domain-containing protein [Myxococcota bacterium]